MISDVYDFIEVCKEYQIVNIKRIPFKMENPIECNWWKDEYIYFCLEGKKNSLERYIYWYSDIAYPHLPEICLNMFGNMHHLLSLDGLADFDTSQVKNMSYMFENCYQIKSLDPIANWNVSNVENMEGLFTDCYNLENIFCLSNWKTPKLNNLIGAFDGCNKVFDLSFLKSWKQKKGS